MSEFDHEPIRGLPGYPPAGEKILWQGAPRWQTLAYRAFHVRELGGYFGVLILWHSVTGLRDGRSLAAVALATLIPIGLTLLALAVLSCLAYLTARATVYTITSRRVVIRSGLALPMTINLPYRVVESLSLRNYSDGSGDLPLRLVKGERIGYLVNWPHVRPWHVTRTEPMLRAIPNASAVGEILAQALIDAPATVAGKTGATRPASIEPVAA
jgi:hypothetical protein